MSPRLQKALLPEISVCWCGTSEIIILDILGLWQKLRVVYLNGPYRIISCNLPSLWMSKLKFLDRTIEMLGGFNVDIEKHQNLNFPWLSKLLTRCGVKCGLIRKKIARLSTIEEKTKCSADANFSVRCFSTYTHVTKRINEENIIYLLKILSSSLIWLENISSTLVYLKQLLAQSWV